jgi:hypothetical protein
VVFYVSSTGSDVRVTEAFRDAETLAVFANLDPVNLDPLDSANVTYFRNNYPDFAPSEWWDYLCRTDGGLAIPYEDIEKIKNGDPNYRTKLAKIVEGQKQWQSTQHDVQSYWNLGFDFTTVLRGGTSAISDLLKLVFYVYPGQRQWGPSQVLLPNGTIYELDTKLYSFHKAVLYLHQHPQQAKRCKDEKCRKYFVHVHGKREFCEYPDSRGETCRYKNDNKRKLDYYYEAGKKRRQAKMRKSSPRLPGSRRRKVTAKA